MTPAVQSMVAVTYVSDIEPSRAFYELLGFREHSAGRAPTAGWCYLEHNGHFVLLATTQPPLGVPPMPLLFYFFFDDLDAVVATLGAAGVEVEAGGRPPHALGGEVRVMDPDGNTLLLGQREWSASQPPPADDETSPHFSLLREAAALVAASGGTTATCQVGESNGQACPDLAEVKLADSGGDAAWACLAHADEILMTVRSAFIASPDNNGLAAFMRRRRRPVRRGGPAGEADRP